MIYELLIIIIMYMNLFIMYKWSFYYLSFLIIMEFLNVFFIFFMILYLFNLWLFFMFLMFMVCEGILGLLLLISMNYEFGHQKMIFLNLLI
uniref:NADH dehydrogenase subunit 4L n=1 Tax=Melipona scutellaris TaxID=263364 RepID=A0A0B4U332_9HYME|nr:NADH dehydrogenase subunit 4L [Melipona scutellaris]AJC00752.1 NADH dehydrogenase subunit 4L [Melipona scutellaris]